MNTDPESWLTDTGAKAHAEILNRGQRLISTTCTLDAALARSPYTGPVQALDPCYVNAVHRQKGEVFMVTHLTLRPDDPYLPSGPPCKGEAPELTTPFRRDFVESIVATASEVSPP